MQSSYFMKSPPIQIHDDVARERVEAFIRGEDNEALGIWRDQIGLPEGRIFRLDEKFPSISKNV